MNISDTTELLISIQARDQRTIGEADFAAWAHDLDDVAPMEAVEAVSAFFRSEVAQRRRIVAADIVQWVKHRRRQLVEQQHADQLVGEARGAWREITGDTGRGGRDWRGLWTRLKAEQREVTQARRASVLRHQDLAAALCGEPIGFGLASQWNGYLPEADSPRRRALVGLVEEAARRDAGGLSAAPA